MLYFGAVFPRARSRVSVGLAAPQPNPRMNDRAWNTSCAWRGAGRALVFALFVSVVACGGGPPTGPVETVRGAVVDLEARSLLELSWIDVVDDAGSRWHFSAGQYKGFTPSHLREHMVQGQRVVVTYRNEEGTLVIVDIEDK